VGPRRPGRERFFPHQFMYKSALRRPQAVVSDRPKDSWLLAAAEKNLPSSSPLGRLDAGNMYAGHCITGDVKSVHTCARHRVHDGAGRVYTTHGETPLALPDCGGMRATSPSVCPHAAPGLAARARSAVAYFCQISDSTTSYGSYSGAVPNEKITWASWARKHRSSSSSPTLPSSAAAVCLRSGLVEQAFTCLDLPMIEMSA